MANIIIRLDLTEGCNSGAEAANRPGNVARLLKGRDRPGHYLGNQVKDIRWFSGDKRDPGNLREL